MTTDPALPSLRERLRSETRDAHADAERTTRLMERLSDRMTYRDLLARLYGFHRPAEQMLTSCFAERLGGLDFPVLRRSSLLLRDLAALGVPIEDAIALPDCPYVPKLADHATAMGLQYVIEGSALGGMVIARKVAAQLDLGPSCGAAFFTLDADQAGLRWREFLGCLERASPVMSYDAVVAAALATFASYSRWIAGDRP